MDITTLQFHHTHPVQIRFNDIDMMGHVNNATIQEYFDLGRMHYLTKVFHGQLFDEKLALVIASIKTDFSIPVMLEDKVEVKTKVYHIGSKSLKMAQLLIDSTTGELKAKCESVMVCFRKSDHHTEIIPQHWRSQFGAVETDLNF
jgi:acyl-CoA thioester hydrolase